MLLWRWDYDPDVYALPLLSSFIDCLGQIMLVGAFMCARKFDGRAIVEVAEASGLI